MEAKLKHARGGQVLNERATQGESAMTVSTAPSFYGCCGLFDLCSDNDLMSLSFEKTQPFLDWLGWEASKVCEIKKNFISWAGPAGLSTGEPNSDFVTDACADGTPVEWGGCDFTLEDFGRLRRVTPTRDVTKTLLRLCENQPRYRLDGSPITDDDEYDMRIVTEVLMQSLKRRVILGNKSTAGDFDGLNVLVNDGYVNSHGRRCSIMDSIVIDMNGNGVDGGSSMTWNGTGIAATYNFIDILLAVYRRIRQRIALAGGLSNNIAVGDMVLVAPTNLIQCILNAFTCWSVCPGSATSLAFMDTIEGRKYRDSLNGGMFNAGQITLDGFTVPLMAYDWGLIKGPTLNDAFLLTNQIGGVRLINGQYNDMNQLPTSARGDYQATDGGRLLTWIEEDNTCYKRSVEMQPRLLMWAPWAQARFIDVACSQPGGVMSPDPLESSFFPETSFSVESCEPEDETQRT